MAKVELIPIYEGPTVFADMLREELQERGIRSVLRAVGPYLGIIGDGARTPFSLVLIADVEMEQRRAQVEECLAMVLPPAAPD